MANIAVAAGFVKPFFSACFAAVLNSRGLPFQEAPAACRRIYRRCMANIAVAAGFVKPFFLAQPSPSPKPLLAAEA